MLLAAAAQSHSEMLCTVLLIATIVVLIVGVAEALGLTHFTSGNGRFGALVLGVVLLVIYFVVC